ncbi:MAG: hypothetical protein JWM77_3832 [Rhodospirillales bacterium]|nr:hypothetical protein [Rhodospirillales bacterium]
MTSTSHAREPFPFGHPSGETSADLARNWWVVALRGVLGILFGLLCLFMPGPTMLSLVLVFAAYMLVDGIFAIVSAIRAATRRRRWGWLAFEGVTSVIAGLIALLWPGLTLIAFIVLMAVWAILSGALMVGAATVVSATHGRWWMVAAGIISVIYGVLLLIAPLIGALVLTWWLGGYALFFGGALLVLAFRLRSHRHEHPHMNMAAAA